eukprot:664585-Prymnesium_polylepis.1
MGGEPGPARARDRAVVGSAAALGAPVGHVEELIVEQCQLKHRPEQHVPSEEQHPVGSIASERGKERLYAEECAPRTLNFGGQRGKLDFADCGVLEAGDCLPDN